MRKSCTFASFLSLLFLGLMLAACSNPQEKEAQYLKRGNVLFENGEYDKARLEYMNALRIKPTDAELAYRIGLIDEAEGNFRAAFASFTRAQEQDVHFHPALLKLGEYYLAAELYDDVQKRVDMVLSDVPDNAGGHALHGALLLRQKDYEGAEKEARFALSKDPKNIVAFSVLTGLYSAQGDENKSVATVEDGIAQNPKSLPLLLLKAQLFEKNGNLPKIAESYEQIFKLAPKESRYHANLATIYFNAGRPDDAEAALREGVAALPDDWDMKRQLVSFLGDHRSVDAAEKEIRSIMQANPERPEPHTWLVDLYVGHNDVDKAIITLNQVIVPGKYDRVGLDARTSLARISYIQGKKDDAQRLVTEVLDNDPNNLDARFIKAHLEADNGYYDNAIADLRIIIRDQPKAKEALHLLSETLLQQGHTDLAIETLSQLVESDPLNFSERVRLAQLYHMNGDLKHAMDLLFFVTKTEPKYAIGWESTARVAIEIKDWPTAETAIAKLDALEGQHNLAAYLRGQLLSARGSQQEAIAQYTQVVNAEPASPLGQRALAALVIAYSGLNKMDEATNFIASLKSTDPVINTILGECYLATGKKDLAIVALDAAIAANSTRQDTYIDRAKLYYADKKNDEAIAILKKGIAAAPSDLRAPLMQAEILGETGKHQEAVTIYDQLLARNPELDSVANNLAELIADYQYADPAALEKAQHVAERFVASSNPLFLDTLGWVYYRQGRVQDAEMLLQRAMAGDAKLPAQVHYHYGAILLGAKRPQDAKAELLKATIKDADYPGLDDAKKMLMGL